MSDPNDLKTLPMRVLVLERDLTNLEARCRECRAATMAHLIGISKEISTFGQQINDDVIKINVRIDGLLAYLKPDGRR